MLYIGIDPGKTGGLSAIRTGEPEDNFVRADKMKETERDISDWFHELTTFSEDKFCMIEKVGSMPGNAARAMFTFGANYGFLRGCLISHGISFEEVLPRKWQAGLGIVPRKKTETSTQHKNKLKSKAQQLFPEIKITLSNCDGLLIAEYNRRKHEGIL